MKPQINVITLAVNDLEKSFAFYRNGLGFPTKGIIGTEPGVSTRAISKISTDTYGKSSAIQKYSRTNS